MGRGPKPGEGGLWHERGRGTWERSPETLWWVGHGPRGRRERHCQVLSNTCCKRLTVGVWGVWMPKDTGGQRIGLQVQLEGSRRRGP